MSKLTREAVFLIEFKELLKKHDAEIQVEKIITTRGLGYSMTLTLNTVYKQGTSEIEKQYGEFDLGIFVDGSDDEDSVNKKKFMKENGLGDKDMTDDTKI